MEEALAQVGPRQAHQASNRDAAAAFDEAQRLFWISLNDAARMGTRSLARRLQLRRAGGDVAYLCLH